jgi:hypothetical protein
VEWGREIMMGLKWTFLQQKLGRLFEAIFKVFYTKLFCILLNYKVICSMLNCKNTVTTVNIEGDGWILDKFVTRLLAAAWQFFGFESRHLSEIQNG